MALLIFLPAATRTWIVAADFVALDHLLIQRTAVAAHELQLLHLFFLLALNIPREILDRRLRRPLLALLLGLGRRLIVLFFLFVLVLIHWERQHGRRRRGRPLRDLQKEEIPDGLVFDPVHHVLEEDERFLLVLDQGILLPVPAQP